MGMKSPKTVSVPPQMPLRSQICLTTGKCGENVIQGFHFFSLVWSFLQSPHMQFALTHFPGEYWGNRNPRRKLLLLLWVQHPRGPSIMHLPKGQKTFRADSPRMGSPKWVMVQSQWPGSSPHLLQTQRLLHTCGYSPTNVTSDPRSDLGPEEGNAETPVFTRSWISSQASVFPKMECYCMDSY